MSYKDAKALFGNNFIGREQVNVLLSAMNEAPLPDDYMPVIPYSDALLKEKAASHLLILGFPGHKDKPLDILKFRSVFGTDPGKFEPCLYNQDWYLNEAFVRSTLAPTWYLIKKEVFEDSRAVAPEVLLEGDIHFPSAILCVYTFFAFRLSCGDWRLTVCAGDFPYMKGGHASGGAITLLWHRAYGPVLAAANTDYSLREPNNQQQTRRKKLHGSLCPRLEMTNNGAVYSQVYDFAAEVAARSTPEGAVVCVTGCLCDLDHQPSAGGEKYSLEYTLTKKGLAVKGGITKGPKNGASFVLPIIWNKKQLELFDRAALIDGSIRVISSAGIEYRGPVFNLAPGFEAATLIIHPSREGLFDFSISWEDA